MSNFVIRGKNSRDSIPDRSVRTELKKQRRRLLKRGPSALDDDELIETLLFSIISSHRARRVTKRLLEAYGSISAILVSDFETLRRIPGLKKREISFLLSTKAMSDRAAVEHLQERSIIENWDALLTYVRQKMVHNKREQVRVLFLDRKNRLISDQVMSDGTVDHAPVYPREIARRALELSASGLVLVHNHPSGDPAPSRADISMTRDLIDALTVFEIVVHDHLIVGRNAIASMKQLDLI